MLFVTFMIIMFVAPYMRQYILACSNSITSYKGMQVIFLLYAQIDSNPLILAMPGNRPIRSKFAPNQAKSAKC
jgi:hypothetical protein